MTRLQNLIQVISRRHVYIQMHNYPDQDALAAALGLKVLLEYFRIKATICYHGRIDKYNTLHMIKLLNFEIIEISTLTMTKEDEIILVDGQKGNGNLEEGSGEVIACIDHHPYLLGSSYKFSDIRSELGACSTIIAEYFLENNITMSEEVATALLYGIKMDTLHLTRGVSNIDIDMYAYLYKKANIDLLIEFDNCSLQMKDLDAYQEAISTLRIFKGVGIAKIGNDCSEAIIGSISDFLLTLVEVRVTLVYAYRVGGIKFSIRSENKGIDVGSIIKEALKGLGDGGGHSTMAAGFVPNISDTADIEEISGMVINRVLKLVEKDQENRN